MFSQCAKQNVKSAKNGALRFILLERKATRPRTYCTEQLFLLTNSRVQHAEHSVHLKTETLSGGII